MENKKTIVAGSATIMVMMVMIILVIIGTMALNTATMLHELAVQRVQTQQQMRASHALVYYGIACCKIIDGFKKKKKEYTYTIEKWPNATSKYNGKVVIIPQKRWYEVKTNLFEGNRRMAQGSCFVWKEKTLWKIASFIG